MGKTAPKKQQRSNHPPGNNDMFILTSDDSRSLKFLLQD
jgi:hypothetical protein